MWCSAWISCLGRADFGRIHAPDWGQLSMPNSGSSRSGSASKLSYGTKSLLFLLRRWDVLLLKCNLRRSSSRLCMRSFCCKTRWEARTIRSRLPLLYLREANGKAVQEKWLGSVIMSLLILPSLLKLTGWNSGRLLLSMPLPIWTIRWGRSSKGLWTMLRRSTKLSRPPGWVWGVQLERSWSYWRLWMDHRGCSWCRLRWCGWSSEMVSSPFRRMEPGIAWCWMLGHLTCWKILVVRGFAPWLPCPSLTIFSWRMTRRWGCSRRTSGSSITPSWLLRNVCCATHWPARWILEKFLTWAVFTMVCGGRAL